MNLEDYPPLSTQPIGLQADGTVVMLFPIGPTQLATVAGGPVTLADLPTADPLVAGQIWNDDGVPTVSAG